MTLSARILIGLGISIIVPAGARADEPDRLFPRAGRADPGANGACTATGRRRRRAGCRWPREKACSAAGRTARRWCRGSPARACCSRWSRAMPPRCRRRTSRCRRSRSRACGDGSSRARTGPRGWLLNDRRFDGRPGGRSGPCAAAVARRTRPELASHADRRVRPRPARGRGPGPSPGGRPPHPHPPPDLRPPRPAAYARGDRPVRLRPAPRTPTSGWSTGCWPRRDTASGGAATGSTSSTTATPTATTRTSAGTTPGPIAIT